MGPVNVTLTQIHTYTFNIFSPEESHWSNMGIVLTGLKADILHHLCVYTQG